VDLRAKPLLVISARRPFYVFLILLCLGFFDASPEVQHLSLLCRLWMILFVPDFLNFESFTYLDKNSFGVA
jgi:hypothetical protein